MSEYIKSSIHLLYLSCEREVVCVCVCMCEYNYILLYFSDSPVCFVICRFPFWMLSVLRCKFLFSTPGKIHSHRVLTHLIGSHLINIMTLAALILIYTYDFLCIWQFYQMAIKHRQCGVHSPMSDVSKSHVIKICRRYFEWQMTFHLIRLWSQIQILRHFNLPNERKNKHKPNKCESENKSESFINVLMRFFFKTI